MSGGCNGLSFLYASEGQLKPRSELLLKGPVHASYNMRMADSCKIDLNGGVGDIL